MDLKSNEPFWLLRNGLIASYPSLRENISCDILVIGGGITGALIAHQCIQDGFKTILVDKREIGNGSSSATTSMLQYEIDVPLYLLKEMIEEEGALEVYQACSNAIDQLEEIAKSIRSSSCFRKKKSLYFAARKKDRVWLQEEFKARKEAGFAVRWLETEEIAERLGVSKSYGGILSQQGASVDAFHLLHEILIYNQKKGLTVFDKTTLLNVEYSKRGVVCGMDTGATVNAKKIIYCVGYESQQLIKEPFVDLMSTFAIVSEVDHDLVKAYKDILVWNTADPYVYMRATEDGRLLLGGGDEPFQNPKKRDALLGRKAEKLRKGFEKINSALDFKTDFVWAGTFGETKDGLPYIGEHEDFEHSYFVLGFGGNGITFSVTGMEMVSCWLKGDRHKLTPYFAFGR